MIKLNYRTFKKNLKYHIKMFGCKDFYSIYMIPFSLELDNFYSKIIPNFL